MSADLRELHRLRDAAEERYRAADDHLRYLRARQRVLWGLAIGLGVAMVAAVLVAAIALAAVLVAAIALAAVLG